MIFECVGIIGCGLIGSSFAKAIRKAKLAQHIIGFDKHFESAQDAKVLGILDEVASSAEKAASGSDLILVATPVGVAPHIFANISPLIQKNALLMDVGSTKLDVILTARKALQHKISQFVPAHPIAGSNVSGHIFAQEDLFQYANVILTPLAETEQVYLDQAVHLWKNIGASVQLMQPEIHDQALGAVSHFPHLLAFAYMSNIIERENAAFLLSLAGNGFKDFTRIAGSDPTLWRDVFTANRAEIIRQITTFKETLTQYETLLQDNNASALLKLLQEASESRMAWLNNKPMKKESF